MYLDHIDWIRGNSTSKSSYYTGTVNKTVSWTLLELKMKVPEWMFHSIFEWSETKLGNLSLWIYWVQWYLDHIYWITSDSTSQPGTNTCAIIEANIILRAMVCSHTIFLLLEPGWSPRIATQKHSCRDHSRSSNGYLRHKWSYVWQKSNVKNTHEFEKTDWKYFKRLYS